MFSRAAITKRNQHQWDSADHREIEGVAQGTPHAGVGKGFGVVGETDETVVGACQGFARETHVEAVQDGPNEEDEEERPGTGLQTPNRSGCPFFC